MLFHRKFGEIWSFYKHLARNLFFCLSTFRQFFFQFTFTGGNPWPQMVLINPFGMKSVVVFFLQFEKSICLLRSSVHTCTEVFNFGSSFCQSFESSCITVLRRSRVPQVACCCKKIQGCFSLLIFQFPLSNCWLNRDNFNGVSIHKCLYYHKLLSSDTHYWEVAESIDKAINRCFIKLILASNYKYSRQTSGFS